MVADLIADDLADAQSWKKDDAVGSVARLAGHCQQHQAATEPPQTFTHDGIQGRCPCRTSFLRHFEMLVEKVARGMVGGQPCSMHKKVMNFIGKDQLLERDALLAERLGEIDRFRKWNVTIIVALDQENWRAPSAYGRKRRGFPRQSCKICPFPRLVGRSEGGNLRVPVVDAVHIDSSSEEVRSASQAERRQVAAIAAAPQADAGGIHVGARAKIKSRAFDIIEFACTRCTVVERLSEVKTVADAAAIVHGKNNVTASRQVLIHCIGVAAVEHVVPAEQHLPARSTVEKDERGMTRPIGGVARQKELAMNRHAVYRRENHLLRGNQGIRR